MMTRRFLLAAGAVTAAAAMLPAAPALAVEVASPAAAPPLLPAWVVGTPDRFDWQIARATTADEALRQIAFDMAGHPCACSGDQNVECDFCGALQRLDIIRVAHMDDIENPTPADWLRTNCGHCCSRCNYETFPEEGGHPVGDEAVCEECMTLEDWQIVDPKRYAEMIAEREEA